MTKVHPYISTLSLVLLTEMLTILRIVTHKGIKIYSNFMSDTRIYTIYYGYYTVYSKFIQVAVPYNILLSVTKINKNVKIIF